MYCLFFSVSSSISLYFFFFFFQAEDGIRDVAVTGVQTCALPIYPIYHPFNWRGWTDWGVGAIGDMGAHLIDHTMWALNLGFPTSVETVSTPFNGASYPSATLTFYEFPARGPMPPVKLDRKSTRLNSSHGYISYAVFCLKKKKTQSQTGARRCSCASSRRRAGSCTSPRCTSSRRARAAYNPHRALSSPLSARASVPSTIS